MPAWAEFRDVFNRLVALSEAAFAARDYEAAAHLLAAALEVARHSAGLLAADQRARLAELAPQHPMVGRTPGQPGRAGPYKALETIMAYLQVLRAREQAAEEREACGQEGQGARLSRGQRGCERGVFQ